MVHLNKALILLIVIYTLYLCSCSSDMGEKSISCEEFYRDSLELANMIQSSHKHSTYMDSMHLDSILLFVEKNMDLTFSNRSKDHDESKKRYKIKKKRIKVYHVEKKEKYESLNLQCYEASIETDALYNMKILILENFKTGFKCIVPASPYVNRNTGLNSTKNVLLFKQMDKYQHFYIRGFEKFLNHSGLKIEDIDIGELYNLFDPLLNKRIIKSMMNRVNNMSMEGLKEFYVQQGYYKKESIEPIFNYLSTVPCCEVIDDNACKTINLYYYSNRHLKWIQIKAPKRFEYFNEYRFIVNHYTF